MRVENNLKGKDPVVAPALELRQKLGTDYALATGPFRVPVVAGNKDHKPELGYFSFALASHAGVRAKTVPFTGHPDILKPRSARQALDFLRLALSSSEMEVA